MTRRPTLGLRCEHLEDRTTPTTFTVTTAVDVVDPNDGVTSLREAIAESQTPLPPGQYSIIEFAPELTGATIELSQIGSTTAGPAAFEIRHSVLIAGSGQKITRASGAPNFRFFSVFDDSQSFPPTVLSLRMLELVGGYSDGMGGAIYSRGASVGLERSVLADNSAAGFGGAIYIEDGWVGSSVSTLTGNVARPTAGGVSRGGAIFLANGPEPTGRVGSARVRLSFSTLVGNVAEQGAQVYADLGSWDLSGVEVETSILYSPQPVGRGVEDLVVLARINPPGIPNKYGTQNLIGLVSGSEWDVVSTADPLLGPLQDNGGATRTMLPQPGSPVIDADLSMTAIYLGIEYDQRYYPRRVGSAPDLGAVEAPSPPTEPLLVYANDGWLGLRPGTVIPDADPTQPGDQPAVYGQTAFYNLTEALAAAAAVGGHVYSFGGFSSGFPATVAAGTVYFPGGAGGTEWAPHTSGITFAPTAVFAVDLNGPTEGTGYDRLGVFGTANIEGAFLQVNTGYTPNAGESFTILTAGEIVGTFAGLPDGATVVAFNGTRFKIRYTATEVVLERLQDVVEGGTTSPVYANTQGQPALATGAAAGQPPEVVVYDANGNALRRFLAYHDAFLGGVSVAVGDVTGDGIADIITAAGAGGGPHVKVFDGRTFEEIASFYAYDPGFAGGVSLAVGDVNADGRADIITGAGPGGGPHVKVFDGRTLAEVRSFYAYDESFRGGVNVAVGNGLKGMRQQIVTGAGSGGGPHVKVFDPDTLAEVRSFYAYDPGFAGGVNVAADGLGRIVTGAGPGGGPHLKVFLYSIFDSNGSWLKEDASLFTAAETDSGGVQVGFERGRLTTITRLADGETKAEKFTYRLVEENGVWQMTWVTGNQGMGGFTTIN